MSKAHPGFNKVADKIAGKEGVSKGAADAILASSTRKAGKSARKANPKLNKVRGGKANPFANAAKVGK